MSDLEGAVVIVTGGGSGIGQAVAWRLAANGARVVIAGRRSEPLAETRSRCGGGIDCHRVDITSTPGVNRLVQEVTQKFGRLDGVVNAAGVSSIVATEDLTDDEFDSVMSVNLRGAFLISRAAGREMISAGSGSIVHIGSLASERGLARRLAYTCSKHAVLGLVRTLAAEWSSRGVRVNAVSPGWVRTPMTDAAIASGNLDADRIAARTPMGRWASPEDVVGATLFLLGASSMYISGIELIVDGGWSAALDVTPGSPPHGETDSSHCGT